MDSMKCPITGKSFRDPVIGSDGHTYEKDDIIAWLNQNATSPLTGELMTASSLRPNYAIKKMIDELTLISKHPYQFCLNVDVQKTDSTPLFQAFGKTIYKAKWMHKNRTEQIILLYIDGIRAIKEASFFVHLSCHPHIVRTFGFVESKPNSVMLVQEFAKNGDLSGLLLDGFKPSRAVILEIFQQIVDAMICLADNGIVHGDLACRNVLVFQCDANDPEKNLVKLTDFGLTRASSLFSGFGSSTDTTATIIPVRYAANEILITNGDHSSYSEKSDIYSMGVTMWEILSYGTIPYSSIADDDEVKRRKISGEFLPKPDNCENDLWSSIIECCKPDPVNRHTFKSMKKKLMRLQNQQTITEPSVVSIEDIPKVATTHFVNESNVQVTCEFCKLLCPIAQYKTHHAVCPSRESSQMGEVARTSVSQVTKDNISSASGSNSLETDKLDKHQALFSEKSSIIQIPPTNANVPKSSSSPVKYDLDKNSKLASTYRTSFRSSTSARITYLSKTPIELPCVYCSQSYPLEDLDLHRITCPKKYDKSFSINTITPIPYSCEEFKPPTSTSVSTKLQDSSTKAAKNNKYSRVRTTTTRGRTVQPFLEKEKRSSSAKITSYRSTPSITTNKTPYLSSTSSFTKKDVITQDTPIQTRKYQLSNEHRMSFRSRTLSSSSSNDESNGTDEHINNSDVKIQTHQIQLPSWYQPEI